jgi:hypothetical protein
MRHSGILLIAATVVLSGCGDAPSGVRTVSQIAGEYELVRYFDQSLPADNFGRGTVEARHLSLLADQRFTKTSRGTICILGSCARADGSESGVWMILVDGSLYFDALSHTSWPPQRVVANGQELRFMISSGDGQFAVSEVYERR